MVSDDLSLMKDIRVANAPFKSTSKSSRCASLLALLKDTFSFRDSQYAEEFAYMEFELQTKTVIFHVLLNIFRCGFSALGQSYW